MVEKILKREPRMANGGLCPVEKNASGFVDEDIAGIEVEMIKNIGNAGILENRKRIVKLRAQSREFPPGKRWGRRLGLLLHECSHHFHERVNHFRERGNPEVGATDID